MSNYPYLTPAVKEENTYPQVIKIGQYGIKAKRVHEWVSFHNFGTAIDGDFSPATLACARLPKSQWIKYNWYR